MVYSNVSGTFDLPIDPSWKNVQTDEIRVLCDTSGAPVIINLPQISALNGSWGVKVYVTDNTGNASTNNIIVNAFAGDEIDGSGSTTYVIDNDGSTVMLAVASMTQWVGTEGQGGGSGSPVIWYSKTYAQMTALQGASGFVTGAFYWISDRNIWIQAVSTSLLALEGSYVHATLTPVLVSQITYDLTADLVLTLRDKYNNFLSFDAVWIAGAGVAPNYILTMFPYGDPNFYGNTIKNSYLELSIDGTTFYNGTFANNVIEEGCDIYGLYNKVAAVGNNISSCTFINSMIDVGFDENNAAFDIKDSRVESGQLTFYGTEGCLIQKLDCVNSVFVAQFLLPYINVNRVSMTSDSELYMDGNAFNCQLQNSNIDNTTVSVTANTRNTSVISLNATGNSTVNIVDVSSASNLNVGGGSSLTLNDLTRNPSDLSVLETSFLTIANRTATGSNTTIYVQGSSVVSISGGTGTINDWFVSDNSSVTLNSNSTTKTNLKIQGWTVVLDAAVAHSQGSLFIDDDSGFTPSYASNIIVFYDYATKVAANLFQVAANTVDTYVGIMYFFNCSVNPALPSQLEGFSFSSFLKANIVLYLQVATGQYLQIVQDPQPIASGRIGMPASLTLYGGADANQPSDTIKLQKMTTERFYQLDAWTIG